VKNGETSQAQKITNKETEEPHLRFLKVGATATRGIMQCQLIRIPPTGSFGTEYGQVRLLWWDLIASCSFS